MADIASWSTTAALNVLSSGTVGTGGVNVDEGMFPGDVNGAMRDIMARIKAQQTTGQVVIGHTAPLSVIGLDGNLQVWGTTAATGTLGIGAFSATATTCANIVFYRSKNAAIGSATVVADGDRLGTIAFSAAQQTGTFSNSVQAAQIRAEVDGVVTSGASGDMPGRLLILTTPDGSSTLTERVRVASDGNVTLANLLTLTSGQIAFPASQNASAGANTFDDYEEGTWTPGILFGGLGVGITYSARTGTYTKLGNAVVKSVDITLSSKGSSTGAATYSLPFTAGTPNTALDVGFYTNFTGLTGAPCGVVSGSTGVCSLYQTAAASTAQITDAAFTATTRFIASATYFV